MGDYTDQLLEQERAAAIRRQQAGRARLIEEKRAGIADAFTNRFGSVTGQPAPGAPPRAAVAPPEAAAAPPAGAGQPSYDRIMEALRNAHAAGDTEAATRLAAMARQAQARQRALALAAASVGAEGGQGANPPAAQAGPPVEVRLPNGTIVEFPAGTPDAVMDRAIGRLMLEQELERPGLSGVSPEGLAAIQQRLGPLPHDQIMALSRRLASQGRMDDARRVAQGAVDARRSALTGDPAAGMDPRLGMQPGALPAAPAAAAGAPTSDRGMDYGDPFQRAFLTHPSQRGNLLPPQPSPNAASAAGGYDELLALARQAQSQAPAEPTYDASGFPLPPPGEIPAWAGAARQAAGEGVTPYGASAAPPLNPEGRNWLRSWQDDGNPETMSRGEQAAAWLNNAGEAVTFGLLGDEAAGRFDELIGRGSAEERTQFYRDQEAQLWEQYPTDALSSEVAGGLLGPGLGAARFIGQGVGTLARMGRGLLAGGGGGAVAGAMEAEGDMLPMEPGEVGGVTDRAMGGLLGAVTGGVGGAVLTGIGQGFTRAAQALRGAPGAEEAVASVDELKEAAQGLYRAADESGITVAEDRLSRLAAEAERTIVGEGYRPRLHPRLAEVLDELREMAAAPAGLGRIELARRVAGMAARSTDADERRLASLIIDRIDGLVDSLGDDSAVLRQAREVWARMRRLGRVEEIIEKASTAQNLDGSPGAFERSLASQFRTFVANPRNLRGFNEAERRAMAQIARGSGGVRALRGFAKMFAPDSIQGAATALGAGFGGAGMSALALPVAGMGARAIANALVRGQARELPRMVGMTDAQRATVEALLRPSNALAPLAGGPPVQGLLSYFGTEPTAR